MTGLVSGEETRPDSTWTTNPSAVAKFNEHSPLLMIPRYRQNLLAVRAIQFDGGAQDEVVAPADWMRMDSVLTRAAIPHTFESFQGTHTSRIGTRLMNSLLPFFSRSLVF